MADITPPKQTPQQYEPPTPPKNPAPGNLPSGFANSAAATPRTGGPSGGTIAIGAVMLVAGIALSAAGTGRVFIGLIVVGVITLIRGLAGR